MRTSSERDRQAGAKALADWAGMDQQFADGGVVNACEALRLAELLGYLLLEGSPPTQAAAARLVSAMFAYPSHAEALQQVRRATRTRPLAAARLVLAAIESAIERSARVRAGPLRVCLPEALA